jgi:hypothetical protein
MSVPVLVSLAPGSEESETVTIIDLLVSAYVKFTTASVATDWRPNHCMLARHETASCQRGWYQLLISHLTLSCLA